ncbi:AMP-dependent synthetase/ligase [Penicillium italicum]|uniref:AMP-dependent synthetase/ligase n=1 Tax=Penicillium italicum TaxID=40296 RepID=A0A0A2KQA2_PENIT|nr:AMP-dependent synthetase/ligase [Penicillium italicum]
MRNLNPSQLTRGLPDIPFFRRVLFLAHEGDHTAINDIESGIQASPSRLLHDTIRYRDKLRELIGPAALDHRGIVREENVFVIIISPGNYEFMVALCAIIAVGAAAIPLATTLLPEEVLYFREKFNSALILTGSGETERHDTIRQHLKGSENENHAVLIQLPPPAEAPAHVFIDRNVSFHSERPALALFTSGTTGPPKGLIHSIRYFNAFVRELGSSDDVFLYRRPIHNGVGLTDIIRYMLRGNRVDMIDWNSGPERVWKHLQQEEVTILTGSPDFWIRVKEYVEKEISKGSPETLQKSEEALRRLHTTRSSGALTMPSTKRFYRKQMGGRGFVIRFGTTETGPIGLETSCDDQDDSSHVIGRPLPGVEAKLANGDHSELLMKTPTMFTGYWGNEEATLAAFDDEGFYKTGDQAYMQGDTFVVEGRTKVDFINCDSYKVPIYVVETAISSLPYISESHVLPISDSRLGSRVAAVVAYRTMPDEMPAKTLQSLREDLSAILPISQLPTMLRVLRGEDVFPRNSGGKVVNRKLKEMYFPQSQDPSLEEMPTEVQICDFYSKSAPRVAKCWDWAGLNC